MDRMVWVALFASLVGCANVVGNGVAASEVRELPPFEAVANSLNLPVEVEVRPGSRAEVTLRCDENLLPHIKTEVDGGTLHVRSRDGTTIAPWAPCVASVRTDRLVAIASSGSGNVDAGGELSDLRSIASSGAGGGSVLDPVTSPRLAIAASGSGRVTVAAFSGVALEIRSSGAGGVVMSGGAATDAEIHASGSGPVDALAVEARRALVRSSGSGGVSLTVRERLVGTLSGSGDLVVDGDPPDRDVQVSGSGRLQVL